MKDVWVSDNERGEEPIAKVDQVVVVKVVKYVLEFQLTVVIICMHLLGDWLVQVRVKEA